MDYSFSDSAFHIETLTPKQNSPTLEDDLAKFAEKYRKVLDEGHVACITDNPMGNLSFQGPETIEELGLPVNPEQVMIHLNAFHTKKNFDEILASAITLGIKYVLAVSGDGSDRLPRLTGKDVGYDVEAVTSVELLKYIQREYPGKFCLGVAFNPYEPQDHEFEKMRRKADAGAQFVITQPIIGRHEAVDRLARELALPVVTECWMSKKIWLLSECVGYEISQDTVYDPLENLQSLMRNYPRSGVYLALFGFKSQFPALKSLRRQ